MNRYDYYTRCADFDEQEWLTEELYYPDGDDHRCRSGYTDDYPGYGNDLSCLTSQEYEDLFDCEEDWEEEDWEEEEN